MAGRSSAKSPASGRFLLRVPPQLHRHLQAAARACGWSLNEYCARRLAVPGSTWLTDDGASAVVARAQELLGAHLVGVVVYGSVPRGDATPASDVDVLLVVDDAMPVTREIYRKWDAAPVAWGSRPVDPHVVKLPEPARPSLGAWCEAAIDGVVLFERDGAVTRRLAAVRGDIAAGRIVRRSVHGQPYWAVAA